ncbi:hypothetical protein [Paenibacillus nasutitermitis]|uniref:Glycosyl hydrolase family 43 n=1 Tax=Paenibacillus nasutitermitis TaxID=1652958 RepID=A0A916YIJ9_9BACL|nr:hypothetical protein [Paenibacillus nasutitermitis]GGD46735.1 hypothetical protein GCM10010911_00280 [Paenibacillus nasutitermitis]
MKVNTNVSAAPLRRYEPDYIHPTPVLEHGDRMDSNGAREIFLFEHEGLFYMHYDGNGEKSWSCCQAVSKDLIHWEKRGEQLEPGLAGEVDHGGACYGPTFCFEGKWYLYYVSVENTSGAPFYIPALPYRTGLAVADQPEGPWTKVSTDLFTLGGVGSWNEGCICAPYIIHQDGKYLAFYSASTTGPDYYRTIGLAVSDSPSGPWELSPEPLLPLEEQLENASLYFEPACALWFMFVNHVGRDEKGQEFTEAVWVYWSPSLSEWNAEDKAVVLDASNIPWVTQAVGLPSCLIADGKLWLGFDACKEPVNAINRGNAHRDLGMARFDLPLRPPE